MKISIGWWIFISFVLFAGFIGTLAFLSFREDISLVTESYYQEGKNYQQVIEKRNNTAMLKDHPHFNLSSGELRIQFNDWRKLQTGKVQLMRMNDESLDAGFDLTSSMDTVHFFKLPKWKPGFYKIRMTWTMEEKDYLFEQQVVM